MRGQLVDALRTRLALASGKPGNQHQQRGADHDQGPDRGQRPGLEQWIDRQEEPVQCHRHHLAGEIGRSAVTVYRHQQRHRQQHGHEADADRLWWIGAGLGHALHMHPHQQQQQQGHADVNEGEQRKQAVVDAGGINEIADQRATEARQPIHPFKTRNHHVLGELVPRQHVAVDAGDVDQPDQADAGQPRKGAEAVHAIEGEVAQHVQQHQHHHRIRGVAVNAAQDAAEVPLVLGQRLHRAVGAADTGVKERIQVQAAAGDDPEQEKGDRTQVVERIQAIAKGAVEEGFNQHEQSAQRALQCGDHDCPSFATDCGARNAFQTTITNSKPPMMAINPPMPINPMPAISALLRKICSAPATLRCTP